MVSNRAVPTYHLFRKAGGNLTSCARGTLLVLPEEFCGWNIGRRVGLLATEDGLASTGWVGCRRRNRRRLDG